MSRPRAGRDGAASRCLAAVLSMTVAIALLVPAVLAVGAVLVCLLALQIQTRLVEEPHLQRLHDQAYHDYAARVGRYRRTG